MFDDVKEPPREHNVRQTSRPLVGAVVVILVAFCGPRAEPGRVGRQHPGANGAGPAHGDHRETGRATLALAQALEGAQEYKPAYAHFQRALSILDVDGAPQDRVLAHLGVARGAERRNEGDKVLENCSRAWELQSRLPPDSNQLLIIKICVGRAQVMLGNLAKAAAVGRELAQMAMATTDAPVAWRLEASSQAGSYCVAGGDYASARQVAQWQLELARKQLPPDSTQYADMLNSAVAALTHVGDVQTALPYAVLAQDLNQKLRG